MASGRLIDYLGLGPLSDRPTAPNLAPNVLGLWYSSDIKALSVWDGSAWDDVTGTPTNSASSVFIVTELGPSTMSPSTHAGTARYIRCGGDVIFDSAEGYTAGEVYNIRATGAVSLTEIGVTLTAPSGGTLDMASGMSVTVIMTNSTAGDVIGQTVPS